MIARLICYFIGHKRGKKVFTIKTHDASGQRTTVERTEYACPRCKATWTRKVRRPKNPE